MLENNVSIEMRTRRQTSTSREAKEVVEIGTTKIIRSRGEWQREVAD